jgi:hypothetical protein
LRCKSRRKRPTGLLVRSGKKVETTSRRISYLVRSGETLLPNSKRLFGRLVTRVRKSKRSLRGTSLSWIGGIERSKNLQKKISVLKRYANKEAEDDDDSDDDDANASAGDAFGGREEKKQAKKRSKK